MMLRPTYVDPIDIEHVHQEGTDSLLQGQCLRIILQEQYAYRHPDPVLQNAKGSEHQNMMNHWCSCVPERAFRASSQVKVLFIV